jgi:hypothetical protein
LAVVIYAGSLAVARLLLAAVWRYASSGHRPIDEKVSPSMIRAHRIRGLVIPLVFLTSIGISFFSLNAAMYSWLPLLVGDTVLLRVLSRYGW